MTTASGNDCRLGPYKGPDSYEIRDALLFRGREQEAHDLVSLVLSSRLSLLHASSGAGKTSLLNARLQPGLTSLGWLPIRVRLGFRPVEAIKVETLKRVFACPALEARAVERARDQLGLADDAHLGDLLRKYRDLPISDDRKRKVLEPLPSPVQEFGNIATFFCAWLQETIDDTMFADYLQAVLPESRESKGRIGSDTTLNAFVKSLTSRDADESYHTLLAKVSVPAIPLAPFFDNLFSVCADHLPKLSLVLILDQFEEIFTRFTDSGPPPLHAPEEVLRRRREQPDWRLRLHFFEEFEEIYRGGGSDEQGSGSILPIRYLISLRDDYVAKLDPLRRFVCELDRSAYHLDMLGRNEAAVAIREPADQYRYGYSDELFQRILDELTREGRFVEPAHLQMVCDKLWRESGRELSRRAHAEGTDIGKMQMGELDRLQGTQGIFDSVLTDFLSDALNSDAEREEAIELLEPLITCSYTRNIVERGSLVHALLKDAARRGRILEKLEQARIIHVETRNDRYFVEITHEFLIPAILKRMRDLRSDPLHAQQSIAILGMSRLEGQDLTGRASDMLSEREFHALHEGRESFLWVDWCIEVMLRSAIGVGGGAEAVRYWADRFETECSVLPINELRKRMKDPAQRGSRLNLDELGLLLASDQKTSDAMEPRPVWSDEELDLILRSIIVRADEAREADVIHWTFRHGDTYA